MKKIYYYCDCCNSKGNLDLEKALNGRNAMRLTTVDLNENCTKCGNIAMTMYKEGKPSLTLTNLYDENAERNVRIRKECPDGGLLYIDDEFNSDNAFFYTDSPLMDQKNFETFLNRVVRK